MLHLYPAPGHKRRRLAGMPEAVFLFLGLLVQQPLLTKHSLRHIHSYCNASIGFRFAARRAG
jgi:hypothetical protein